MVRVTFLCHIRFELKYDLAQAPFSKKCWNAQKSFQMLFMSYKISSDQIINLIVLMFRPQTVRDALASQTIKVLFRALS